MAAAGVGEVVPLNENDVAVHATMAKTIPKHVIIQSNWNRRYLHYSTENADVPDALQFDGKYSFDLHTRFEVEPDTKGTGLVHIRSLRNNKYWANSGTGNSWITAMAVKPEENQSDKCCTLFQPVFLYSDNNRVLRLRSISTGQYIGNTGHYIGNSYGLLSMMTSTDEAVCTFLDWNSLVMLPDVIRIKCDNGNHLKANADGLMDSRSKADNTSAFDFEVFPSRDGGIRLRSAQFGTYWKDMNDSEWVLLQQASTTVHEASTVFLPIQGEDSTIVFKCLQTGLFCKRFSHDGKGSGLATLNNYPDTYTYMKIEEPVNSRKIVNVRYHLTESRRYNEKTVSLLSDDTDNETGDPLTSQLNLKFTVSNTAHWTRSVSLELGVSVKMTATLGVPLVLSGELQVSTELTKTKVWGEAETESLEVGTVKTITVPSKHRVRATLLATRLSYDIPFSYTQIDVLKNGTEKIYEKKDGIFTGNNGYDYRSKVEDITPK